MLVATGKIWNIFQKSGKMCRGEGNGQDALFGLIRPWNNSVSTNIGRLFLNLVDRHFNATKWARFFNRHTIKVSYCTTKNMAQIINQHNKKMLQNVDQGRDQVECDCADHQLCPLNNKCTAKDLVYKATVKSRIGNNQSTRIYYGMTQNTFKERVSDHNTSFRYERYRNKSSLATYVWKLKDQGLNYNVTWDLVTRAMPWRRGSRTCGLCLAEKALILYERHPPGMLNTRSELMAKCRHANKHFYA